MIFLSRGGDSLWAIIEIRFRNQSAETTNFNKQIYIRVTQDNNSFSIEYAL